MKTRIVYLFGILLVTVCFYSTGLLAQQQKASPPAPVYVPPSLETEERRFLMDYLTRSRQMMHDAVSEITPQQWSFKAKPFRWSVAECAEHIIMTEKWLMTEFATKFGKGNEPAYIFHWRKPKPIASEQIIVPLADRRSFDLNIINDLLDRSKVDTAIPSNAPPEASTAPIGKYKTPDEMLNDFDKQRDETIKIIENLKVNWREYYVYSGSDTFPYLRDGYQYLLRVPAHCERHLMQLWEVKRDSNYPKK